jgi:membrane AbrB-like protein
VKLLRPGPRAVLPGPAQRAAIVRAAPRIGLALGLGLLGGWGFARLSLPLPWMLGPMLANMLASVLGLPVRGPTLVRPYVVVVIGVLLGSSFSPDMLGLLGGWAISLGFLAVYLALTGLLVVPYYRRVGGFDPVTAYFAGMPGGLNEMLSIGRDMGGDERAIILAHASRIVIVVLLVAVWFRWIEGLDMGNRARLGTGFADVPWFELAMLALVGIAGAWLGRRLRLAAPTLVGPMLASALVHAGGLIESAPPREIVVAAQLFLGTIMGCRFLGARPAEIGRALLLGLGATVLMLAVTGFMAVAFHRLFGQSIEQVLLAYAPGGLAEMSLVALAMEADVAYVSLHHLARITLVVLVAPAIFARMRRGTGRNDGPEDDSAPPRA